MTSIICTGHGKSGTTFLDDIFRMRTNVSMSLGEKEIKYFNNDQISLEGYAQNFGLTGDQLQSNDFITFEASPPYVTNQKRPMIERAYKKIITTIEDPKIIIAIRHPFNRAFSHYAHILYEASQRGYPAIYKNFNVNYHGYPQPESVKEYIVNNPFRVSMEEAFQDRELCFSSYLDCYELALKYFGPENILFFSLEQDGRDINSFIKRMNKFFKINVEFDEAPLEPSLEGRGVPYYVYAGEHGRTAIVDGITCQLKPRQLLIVRSMPAILLEDVSPAEYQRLEEARRYWTCTVSAAQASDIYNKYLSNDFHAFVKLADTHYIDNGILDIYRDLKFTEKTIPKASFEGLVAALFKQSREMGLAQ